MEEGGGKEWDREGTERLALVDCLLIDAVVRSRCDTNSPCHHECVDTGVAIHCRCFDGFTLDADGRNCRGTRYVTSEMDVGWVHPCVGLG